MQEKRPLPKNPGHLLENLTHRPFEGLKDLLKDERKRTANNEPRNN